MDKVRNNIPLISVTAVFLIGNAVINLPFSEYPQGVIIGFFLSVILGYLYISLLTKRLSKAKFSKADKVFFALYCLLCATVTVRNFITFSDRVLLPEISSVYPSILFVLLLWFICRQERKIILKISVVSAVIIVISNALLFLFSIENIQISSFSVLSLTDIKGILYEAASFLCLSFLQSVILINFLESYSFTSSVKKGYIIAVAVLLVCFIQCIGVFGVGLTGKLINPYADSVSIISLRGKSTRLEGFSYFLYFSASLIKSAVCILSGKHSLSAVSKKAEKHYPLCCTVIIGLFCVFTSFFKNIDFIYIAPFLALPPIYFMFRLHR